MAAPLDTSPEVHAVADADTSRAVSPDIRRMIGYSIHPPFVGAVNGVHPERVLER